MLNAASSAWQLIITVPYCQNLALISTMTSFALGFALYISLIFCVEFSSTASFPSGDRRLLDMSILLNVSSPPSSVCVTEKSRLFAGVQAATILRRLSKLGLDLLICICFHNYYGSFCHSRVNSRNAVRCWRIRAFRQAGVFFFDASQ